MRVRDLAVSRWQADAAIARLTPWATVVLVLFVLLVLVARAAWAQPLFTDAVPPEEFAARRARLMERIGDAVAVVQGAAEYPAFVRFRQNNHLFYLTGVEVPRAILLLDGRARSATLFLPPRDVWLERSEGPVLAPGPEAERLTGIDRVLPRDQFGDALGRVTRDRKVIYTPFRPESLEAGTPDRTTRHASATATDPWDGRPSRETAFIQKLRRSRRQADLRDLDPILDAMRMVKSPREIALVREATRIAGLAIMEAMRSAQPGMHEYELAAIGDYFFRRHNALGPAYYALVATGQNALYPHYHALQSRLAAGDLVLYDYAPDYQYYASDVTRMFPANGTFSPAQRELYTAYLRLYQALMESIRPHAAPRHIIDDAARRMRDVLASLQFASEKHREAVTRFVDQYGLRAGGSVGHFIGMEVHDVGGPPDLLRPGMIFTIEPDLIIPDEHVYIRLEDVMLITETGYENLSGFVPMEVEDIEKLMAEPGLFEPHAARRLEPVQPGR